MNTVSYSLDGTAGSALLIQTYPSKIPAATINGSPAYGKNLISGHLIRDWTLPIWRAPYFSTATDVIVL